MVQLLDDFSMVNFLTLDITEEESIEACLQQVDMCIQVGCRASRPDRPGMQGALFLPADDTSANLTNVPLQYGEDQDVRVRDYDENPDDPDS